MMMAVSFSGFGVDRGVDGQDEASPVMAMEGELRVHIRTSRFRDLQSRPLVLVEVPGLGAFYVTAADLANASHGIESVAVRELSTPPASPSIACPTCTRVSYNPTDIAQRYCGFCHQFHQDMAAAARG